MKTKVKRFNDLPYEERDVINYYVIEGRFKEIEFLLNMYKEDISPRLKSLLQVLVIINIGSVVCESTLHY